MHVDDDARLTKSFSFIAFSNNKRVQDAMGVLFQIMAIAARQTKTGNIVFNFEIWEFSTAFESPRVWHSEFSARRKRKKRIGEKNIEPNENTANIRRVKTNEKRKFKIKLSEEINGKHKKNCKIVCFLLYIRCFRLNALQMMLCQCYGMTVVGLAGWAGCCIASQLKETWHALSPFPDENSTPRTSDGWLLIHCSMGRLLALLPVSVKCFK